MVMGRLTQEVLRESSFSQVNATEIFCGLIFLVIIADVAVRLWYHTSTIPENKLDFAPKGFPTFTVRNVKRPGVLWPHWSGHTFSYERQSLFLLSLPWDNEIKILKPRCGFSVVYAHLVTISCSYSWKRNDYESEGEIVALVPIFSAAAAAFSYKPSSSSIPTQKAMIDQLAWVQNQWSQKGWECNWLDQFRLSLRLFISCLPKTWVAFRRLDQRCPTFFNLCTML